MGIERVVVGLDRQGLLGLADENPSLWGLKEKLFIWVFLLWFGLADENPSLWGLKVCVM